MVKRNNSKGINCSVVILSYNTKSITKEAIKRAIASKKYCESRLNNTIEIIVVDNASTDGTQTMLKKEFSKDIKLIALTKNKWVSGGYNEGMAKAKYDYILLMNNDTYLFGNTLCNAITWMRNNPKAGAMICKLYTGEMQHGGGGGALPTPFKTIRWIFGFESIPFFSEKLDRIYKRREPTRFNKDTRMGWIPTCFLFMRKEVYEQTGGEDENLPFYMEDVDFCKTITDQGYQIWFTNTVEAIHLGGKSSKDVINMATLLQKQFEGLIYYHQKHHIKSIRLVTACIRFGIKIRVIIHWLLGDTLTAQAYNTVTV